MLPAAAVGRNAAEDGIRLVYERRRYCLVPVPLMRN